MKSTVQKAIKKANLFRTALLAAIFSIGVRASAYATSGLPSVDKEKMATTVKTAVDSVLYAVGGTVIFVGVVLIGFDLIMSRKNPEKRSGAMASLMYAGIGCAVIGGASLIAGFFVGLGSAK